MFDEILKEAKEELSPREFVAFKRVLHFLEDKGYKGDIYVHDVQQRGNCWDISLLKPYGLFIVKPDDSVEDNYHVFTRRVNCSRSF